MKKFLLIVEAVILLAGALLSASGTSQAAKYSDIYKMYYLAAVLGILFVGILEFLRKKKYVVLLGTALILIYFFVAGLLYMDCVLYADNMAFLKRYEGKEIVIYFGNQTYEWNGEAFFHGTDDFDSVSLDGKENYCEINGKKQKIYTARIKAGEPDMLYCQMNGVSNFRNLVFVRRKD